MAILHIFVQYCTCSVLVIVNFTQITQGYFSDATLKNVKHIKWITLLRSTLWSEKTETMNHICVDVFIGILKFLSYGDSMCIYFCILILSFHIDVYHAYLTWCVTNHFHELCYDIDIQMKILLLIKFLKTDFLNLRQCGCLLCLISPQTAKALGLMSIKYQCNAVAMDQCLIDVYFFHPRPVLAPGYASVHASVCLCVHPCVQ